MSKCDIIALYEVRPCPAMFTVYQGAIRFTLLYPIGGHSLAMPLLRLYQNWPSLSQVIHLSNKPRRFPGN